MERPSRMAIKNVCPIYDSWMLFVAAIRPMNCPQMASETRALHKFGLVALASLFGHLAGVCIASPEYLGCPEWQPVNGLPLTCRYVCRLTEVSCGWDAGRRTQIIVSLMDSVEI